MSECYTILIVDDEPRLRDMIRMILENRDYNVIEASNGLEAVTLAKIKSPDLILLDIMMPQMDGFAACRQIREFSSVPIIMLTAKGEDYDQVNGLESGADDYIIKPFTPMVLVARIEANIRRFTNELQVVSEERKIIFKEMIIDIESREVMISGERIDINRREFELLVYMAKNHGISLSLDQLLEKVWGYDYLGSDNTVYTHINRLRKKLGIYEKYIKTIRGYGYKFEVDYEK